MEQENKPTKSQPSKIIKTLLKSSIAIAIIVYLVFLFLHYINRPTTKQMAKEVICRSNLIHISQGVILYSQDNDAVLPTAEKWNDLLVEYIVDKKPYRCPSVNKQELKTCAYHLNRNLYDLKGPLPTDMVMLFDGPVGWNQTGTAEDMVYRHGSEKDPSCNVAFTDGSTIRVRKSEVANLRWKP